MNLPEGFVIEDDITPPEGFELESPSLMGFAKNAVKNVTGTIKEAGQLVEGLATHPIDTSVNFVKGLPRAIVEESKRVGVPEFATAVTKSVIDPFNLSGALKNGEFKPFEPQVTFAKKFGQAVYEKPLTTALDVAPVVGAAGKALGIGGKAAEMGSVASKAAPLAEDLTGAAKAAGQVAEEVPLGSTFQETVSNLGKQVPGAVKEPLAQVGDFLGQKYAKAAEKPNWRNVVADYMKEHGQNMGGKEIGWGPGQIRKMGVEKARNLVDYASQTGLIGPKIGTIGRENLVSQRLADSGGVVGGFRKMAADRGAEMSPDALIDHVRAQLDQKYLQPGLHSGEKGLYMKALMEIKRSGGRADQVADKISELFREAKGLDRLKRPSGPVADVARAMRELNHQQIAKHLTPQEMAIYENGLEDYGALTQINEGIKRRNSVELGGRLGPGSGISRAAVQKFLDSVGYRTEAKIMRNLSEKIRANPDMVATPKDLFRNYVDEAAEAIDDMTEVGQ